jgi:ATP-binding cassette, subfamily B, bacterial
LKPSGTSEESGDTSDTRVPLRRVLGLFRSYWPRLTAVGMLIVASALISLASPFLLREVIDRALPTRDVRLLVWMVIGMIAVSVIGSVLDVIQTWISTAVGQRVMHDLRTSLYTHLQRLSLAFFTRTRTGEVQSRIANDIGGMQVVVTTTLTMLLSSFTAVIGTFLAMLALDWRLTMISMVLLPWLVWISRSVGNQRRRVTRLRQQRMAGMTSLVEESLSVSGILLGKTMGQSRALISRFTGESADVAELEVASSMAGRWRQSTVQIVFGILPAVIYLAAGLNIASGGSAVTIGTLVAFTTLQTRMFMPMMQMLRLGVEIQSSLALFGRVFEYLDLPAEIRQRDDAVRLDAVRGEVRFEGVDFRYAEDGPLTLRDIDIELAPGRALAVVGETGSGKTTMAYLVARLYDVERGRITIDGHDVRDVEFESLSRAVGYVSQETYLFHATVAENLRFAKPDATDEELEAAARGAQIHDLIVTLPDGYDTMVGERGYRFSGGEKQRLAIARTLLRNPPILVLDEATSALDTQTERAVQDALDVLTSGRTTIAIAHRLSTIRDADEIVVLDDGHIVERGTHGELIERDGHYAALVARDALAEAEAEAAEDIARETSLG